MLTALLVSFVLTLNPFNQSAARDGDAVKIEAIRQHIAAFEMSARQAKGRADGDPQKLAVLEKQYAAAATALDTWRTSAVSVKGASRESTKRVEDLAKQAARAMAEFGRDARSLVAGRASTVAPRAYTQFEERLIEASGALSRADEQTREKVYASLGCQTWGEIQ